MNGPGWLPMPWGPLLALFGSFVGARILEKPVCRVLARGGMERKNFRGRWIPTGAGLIIPLCALPFAPVATGAEAASLGLLLLFGMGSLGFVDDAAGGEEHGGFRHHLAKLLAGELTTGAVKALFGGALALYAGWVVHEGRLVTAVVSGLVIALSANAVNLLDVRPGRAIKGALLLCAMAGACLFIFGPGSDRAMAFAAFAAAPLGAALWLLRGDLGASFMIGDAGANALGAAAALMIVALPTWPLVAALAALVSLHAYAERRSISNIFDRLPILQWFDQLGRR